MSLFDVIKYPISSPPTEEELNRIPAEILDQWQSKSVIPARLLDSNPGTDRATLYRWTQFYHKRYAEYESCINDINLLKRLIREHNE